MFEWLVVAFLADNSQSFLEEVSLSGAHDRGSIIERFDPSDLPTKKKNKVAPQFLNDPFLEVLAQDLDSGKILLEHRSNKAQPIASLTKIMTFLVIYEDHNLDEIVEVPLLATKVDGAKIGLYAYEKITIKTLLEAALIPSGNDAARALAITDSGTEEAFVIKMNQKAKSLNLNSAKFYNATGLDLFQSGKKCEGNVPECIDVLPRDYGNTMSAQDVAKLSRVALQNDFFRATVAKREFEGTSVDGKFFHSKKSTNQLFGTFVNTKGVKTGYTFLAGQCFVNLSEDQEGREILTVVLGSSNRFEETKKLMDWIWGSFVWQ